MEIPSFFYVNGLRCGISEGKKKKDLALFYSKTGCSSAGVFTRNLVKAAPVQVSSKNLAVSARNTRAVIVNSGCANACTGARGLRDAQEMCRRTARRLGVKPNQVLVASTGVIGVHLPIKKVTKGIDSLAETVKSGVSSSSSAVEAIMTTDTFPKQALKEIKIGGETVHLWGCAKGAGMIHPNMATLLSFVLTDAAIGPKALQAALKEAADFSFNRVSVDGDTSTNDTLIALAGGAAGNRKISSAAGGDYEKFAAALSSLCRSLAVMVAADGEGATKIIRICVGSAKNENEAEKIAATIATSPLVKTAAFGNDPNWGRIIAAAGRSGAEFNPQKTAISINGTMVARNGQAVNFSESALKKSMASKSLEINVELNSGKKFAEYFTCDFSFDYVKINASYRT